MNSRTNTRLSYLQVARQEALKSPIQSQFGAILIHRNKIIAKSHNEYKSHISDKNRQCIL